jgi:hypothetical protein
VEQKNWTHVRLLLGYQRNENEALIPTINELYRAWDWYRNFYCPTLKILSKSKIGSRYIKKYSAPPNTPSAPDGINGSSGAVEGSLNRAIL